MAAGAKRAATIAELVGQVDHVFTCLPSPVVCEKVLDQVIAAARPGMTWIENSTLAAMKSCDSPARQRPHGLEGSGGARSPAACIWRRAARLQF